MKRTMQFGLIGLVLALAAWTMQNPDVTALVDEKVSIAPATAIVNSARTGIAADRAGYAGAMAYLQTGVVDNVATVSYLVLQDSNVASTAWALVDSVLVDSVDNKAYEINYAGTKRFLRLVQRATANAADSLWASGVIILTGKRSR